MRRWIIIIAGTSVLVLIALSIWNPWAITQTGWVRKTADELRACGPPPPEVVASLQPGRWATRRYLIFSNDWACYAYSTFHDSKRVGDIALLRSADGILYISHHHFCAGLPEPPDAPRPANVAEFLRTTATEQKWTRQPGGKPNRTVERQ